MPKYAFYRPHARVQYDGSVINPHTGEVSYPPSRTKQEFKRECDINNILKQFSRTGIVTHISAKAAQGAYMDLPEGTDFQEALDTVQAGTTAFNSLPAKVRDRFGNDPAQFLVFMADPANLPEMRELGLASPAPPPATGTGDNPTEPPATP